MASVLLDGLAAVVGVDYAKDELRTANPARGEVALAKGVEEEGDVCGQLVWAVASGEDKKTPAAPFVNTHTFAHKISRTRSRAEQSEEARSKGKGEPGVAAGGIDLGVLALTHARKVGHSPADGLSACTVCGGLGVVCIGRIGELGVRERCVGACALA